MAGEADPCHEGFKAVTQICSVYRKAGKADPKALVYGGARHELFNETNRDEITQDLVAWLGGVFGRAAAVAPGPQSRL